MPLRYDANSLLVPGGAVAGLDNMGAAVVAALSRRADRRYSREAEDRTNSRRDMEYTRQMDEAERQHARSRVEARTDATRSSLMQGAGQYSPLMDQAGTFSDIEKATDDTVLNPEEALAARALRMGAQGRYQLMQERVDKPTGTKAGALAKLPTQVKVPPAKTYRDPGQAPKLDIEGRISDLNAAAAQAQEAGFHDQAAELLRQRDALVEARSLQAPSRPKLTPTTIDEFIKSPEFGALHVPAPVDTEKTTDLMTLDPTGSSVTPHKRPGWWFGNADEKALNGPNSAAELQAALARYNTGRKNAADDSYTKESTDYNDRRTRLLAAMDPATAAALSGAYPAGKIVPAGGVAAPAPAAGEEVGEVPGAPDEVDAAAAAAAVSPEARAARVEEIRARLKVTDPSQDFSTVSDEDLLAAYGMTDDQQ